MKSCLCIVFQSYFQLKNEIFWGEALPPSPRPRGGGGGGEGKGEKGGGRRGGGGGGGAGGRRRPLALAPLGLCPRPHQGHCPWTPQRPGRPLDTDLWGHYFIKSEKTPLNWVLCCLKWPYCHISLLMVSDIELFVSSLQYQHCHKTASLLDCTTAAHQQQGTESWLRNYHS